MSVKLPDSTVRVWPGPVLPGGGVVGDNTRGWRGGAAKSSIGGRAEAGAGGAGKAVLPLSWTVGGLGAVTLIATFVYPIDE